MSARSRYLAAINAAPPPPPAAGIPATKPSYASPTGPVPAGIGSIDDDAEDAENKHVEVVEKVDRRGATPQHDPVAKSAATVSSASTPSASTQSEKDFSPQLANQKRQWDAQRDIKAGQVSAMAASMFGRGSAPTPPPPPPGSKGGSRRGTPSLTDNVQRGTPSLTDNNAHNGLVNEARTVPSAPVDEGESEGQGPSKQRVPKMSTVASKFEASKKPETEQSQQQASSLTASDVDEGRTEVQARSGIDEETRDTSIPRTQAPPRPSSAASRLFVTKVESESLSSEERNKTERSDDRVASQQKDRKEPPQERPSSEPVFDNNASHDEAKGFGNLFPATPFEGPSSPSFDEAFGNVEKEDEVEDGGKSPTAAELKALVAERRRAALAMYESKELVKHDPVETFLPSMDSFPTAREMNKQAGVISPPSSSSPFVHDDGFGDFGDPMVDFGDMADDEQGFPPSGPSAGAYDSWSRPPAPKTASVSNFRTMADQMPSAVDPSARGANVRVDSPAARRRYMAMQKSQADAMFKPIETSSASWDAFFPSDAAHDTFEQTKAKSGANLAASTGSAHEQPKQSSASARGLFVDTTTSAPAEKFTFEAQQTEFNVGVSENNTFNSKAEALKGATVTSNEPVSADELANSTSAAANSFPDSSVEAVDEAADETAADENDPHEGLDTTQEEDHEEDDEELVAAVPLDKRNRGDRKDEGSRSKSRSFFGLFRRGGDSKPKSKKGKKEAKQKEAKGNKSTGGSFRRPQSRSSTPTETVAAKSKTTARSEAIKKTQQPKSKTTEPKMPPQPQRSVVPPSPSKSKGGAPSPSKSKGPADMGKTVASRSAVAVPNHKEGSVGSQKEERELESTGSAVATRRASTAEGKSNRPNVRATKATVDSQRTITKPVKTSDLSSATGDADDGPAVEKTVKAGDLGKLAGRSTSQTKDEAAPSVNSAVLQSVTKVKPSPPVAPDVSKRTQVESKSRKSTSHQLPQGHQPVAVDAAKSTGPVPLTQKKGLEKVEKQVGKGGAEISSHSRTSEKKDPSPNVKSGTEAEAANTVPSKSMDLQASFSSLGSKLAASSDSSTKEERSRTKVQMKEKAPDDASSGSRSARSATSRSGGRRTRPSRKLEPEDSKDPKPTTITRSTETLPPNVAAIASGRALQGLSKVVASPPDPPLLSVDSIEASDDEGLLHQRDTEEATDQELSESAKENKPDSNGGQKADHRSNPVATRFSKPIVAKIDAMPKESDAQQTIEIHPANGEGKKGRETTVEVTKETTPSVTAADPVNTKDSAPPPMSGKSMVTARAKYRWQVREQKTKGENSSTTTDAVESILQKEESKEESTASTPDPPATNELPRKALTTSVSLSAASKPEEVKSQEKLEHTSTSEAQAGDEPTGTASRTPLRVTSKSEAKAEAKFEKPKKASSSTSDRSEVQIEKPQERIASTVKKIVLGDGDRGSALRRKLDTTVNEGNAGVTEKYGVRSENQIVDGDGDGTSTISSETTDTSLRKAPGTASAVAAMQLVRKSRTDRNKGVSVDRRSKGSGSADKSGTVQKESVSNTEESTDNEKRNNISFERHGEDDNQEQQLVQPHERGVSETTSKEGVAGDPDNLSEVGGTGVSMSKRIMASRKSSSSVSRQARQAPDEISESESTRDSSKTSLLSAPNLDVPNLDEAKPMQSLSVNGKEVESLQAKRPVTEKGKRNDGSGSTKATESAPYQPSVPASSFLSRMGKRGWPNRKLSGSEETAKSSDENRLQKPGEEVSIRTADNKKIRGRSDMDAPLSPVGLTRVANGDEFDLTKVDSEDVGRSSKPRSSHFARARARARPAEVTAAKTSVSKTALLPSREASDVPPVKKEEKRAEKLNVTMETIQSKPAFKKQRPHSVSSLSTRMASAALTPVNVKPNQTAQRPATPDIAAPRSPRVTPHSAKSQRFVPSMLPRGQSPTPHLNRAASPISPRFHATASAVRLSPRGSSPLTISTSPTPEQYMPGERYAFQTSPRLRAAQEKKNKSVVMIDRMEKVDTAAVKIQSLVHIKRAKDDLKERKGSNRHASAGSSSRNMSQRFGGPENVGKPLNRRPASIIKKPQPAKSPVSLTRNMSWDAQKSQPLDLYSVMSNDPIQRAGIRLLSAAAIPIQTEIRRHQAKQVAWRRFCALILVQAFMRRWLWQIRLERSIASTVKIQAAFRGWLARDNLEDEHYCATQIQRIFRGYFATMEVYKDLYSVTIVQSVARMRLAKMEADVRLASIILLQSSYRGYALRLDLENQQRGATVIQTSWRRYSAQTNYQFDIVDIIIVQSVYRRRAAMRVLSDKRFIRDSRCATLIQTQWRAYDCTMNYLHTMADILIVQSVVRRWKAAKAFPGFRFRRYYECSSQIQRVVRGKLAQEYVKRGLAARKIQKTYRGYVEYNAYVEYKAAERIQKIWRGYLSFRNYVEWIAATQLQKTWRGYVAAQNYLEYRSAQKLQKIWRGHRAHRDFVEYLSARHIQRVWRGHCDHQDYLEYRSARNIQKIWRGRCAFRDYVDYQSARSIQRIWRGYCAYNDYVEYGSARDIQKTWRRHRDHRNFTQFIAARTLQNRWRCRVANQCFTRNKAARNIQRMWRGYSALKRYVEFLAARDIQKVWRGYVALQGYVEYVAARDIQRVWRGFVAIQEFVEHIAARDIQTAWRGYVVYRSYMEHLAACEIQKIWRGYVVYLEYTVYIAARDVQRAWRGYFAHKAYAHFTSARRIQKLWRGHVAHTAYTEYTAARSIQKIMRRYAARTAYARYTAARNVQRIWRGHVALSAYTEYTAARDVQRIWRGHVALSAYTEYTAARHVQKIWRGYLAHKAYTAYTSARNIQKSWRGHVAHQAFVRYMAAREVQKIWRGFVAFKRYIRYIAASEIQRTWRGFTAHRNYKRYKAATRIQKVWRGFTAYQKFIEHMAGTYIQKSWRRYSARKSYIQYRSAMHIQRMWRGFQCYTDYIFVIADVIIAQRTARQWLAKRTLNRLIVEREEKKRNEAATTVQKYWRGYQAHMNLLFTLVHIIVAQSVARKYIARNSFKPRMKEHRAARSIQTNWRTYSKRSAFVKYVSARKLQATWRCYVTRQAFVDYLSSRLIQTSWRRYAARNKFVEYSAARRMQLAWRSHAARVKLERHLKARDIQKRWRSFTAREAFVQFLKARSIQKQWRSFSARRIVRENRSARSLQAQWRGYVMRQNYLDYMHARRIQIAWRVHAAKRALTNHQKARSIQSMWRMQVRRRAYVEYVGARKLQSVWRMKSRRSSFINYVGARKIQAVWRMRSRRRAFKEYVAARRMQALWRMYVNREAYVQYVSTRKVQSLWRGVCFRIRRQRAAIMLQKTWRGFMQYSNYVISRFEEHAATTIQRYWRGFLACTQYIIVHFEIVRIQALVRGHQERTWLKHQESRAVVIQTEARRYLAKEEFRERKLISILVNSASAAVRAKGCAKRMQRWWRDTLRRKKEKKSALVIERFFMFVKAEVDKEIQRREKHKQAKREKRQRQKKEADEKLLERVWLNTVESDEQENGLVNSEATTELKPRSGSRSRSRLPSDDKSKHLDGEYRSTRRSTQTSQLDGERPRRDPLLALDSEELIGKHAESPNRASRPSSRTRSSPLRRDLGDDTVVPVAGSHYLDAAKLEAARSKTRGGRDSHPPARTVDLQEDGADVESEVSGLTAPSVFTRPTPPAPSRLGTLSWKELSDDLSLEEAWIDSEIHQVKQKRRSEDQYLQRHGLTASSLSPRRTAPTSDLPRQDVRISSSRRRSRVDQPPPPLSNRRSSSRSRIQDTPADGSRRSSRRSVSAQPTRSSSAPRQQLELEYTRVGRNDLSITTDNLEVKERNDESRRVEKSFRSSSDRRIEPPSTPETFTRHSEAPSTVDAASISSSGERVSRLQRPSTGSQRRRSKSPQVDPVGISAGPSLDSPMVERRTPSKGIPLPTDYGTTARSSRRTATGESSGGRRSAIPPAEPSPSVRRALDFAKRKSQLTINGSQSATPRRSLLVEPSPTATRKTPSSTKSRNPSEGASGSGLQRPRN